MASELEIKVEVDIDVEKTVAADCDSIFNHINSWPKGIKKLQLDGGYSLTVVHENLIKSGDIVLHCLNVFRYLFGLERAIELYMSTKKKFFDVVYMFVNRDTVPGKDTRFINIYELVNREQLSEAEQEIVIQFNKTELTENSILERLILGITMEFEALRVEEQLLKIKFHREKYQDTLSNFEHHKQKIKRVLPDFDFKPYEEIAKRHRTS